MKKQDVRQRREQMNRVLLLLLCGIYASLAIYLKPWQRIGVNFGITENFFALMALVTLMGLIVSCMGIMTNKKWALKYFFLFNVFFLIGGFIAVYVSWLLWFCMKPSLFDRIKSAFLPFIVGVVIPLSLMYHILKIKKRYIKKGGAE